MIVSKENMITNSNSIKPKKIIKISNTKQHPHKRQRLYSQYSSIIPMRCNTSVMQIHQQQKIKRNSEEKPTTRRQQPAQKRYSLTRQNKNNNIHNDANFDKLLQITSRCIKYYNNFINQKNSELMILENAFQQIEDNLAEAFKQISIQIVEKHRQLTEKVQAKYQQIISIKTSHESQLRRKLQDVKSIHLKKLLTDSREQQYLMKDNSIEKDQQLCFYAKTLNGFYEVIDQIEKISFKDKVDQEISKLNEHISSQVKFLSERISNKYSDQQSKENQNLSFSFNDSIQRPTLKKVPSWWMCIKEKQAQRKKKINMYYEVIKN